MLVLVLRIATIPFSTVLKYGGATVTKTFVILPVETAELPSVATNDVTDTLVWIVFIFPTETTANTFCDEIVVVVDDDK